MSLEKRRAIVKGVTVEEVFWKNKCETSQPHRGYGCASAGPLNSHPLGKGIRWYIWEKRTRKGGFGEMVEIPEECIIPSKWDNMEEDEKKESNHKVVQIEDTGDESSENGDRTPTQSIYGGGGAWCEDNGGMDTPMIAPGFVSIKAMLAEDRIAKENEVWQAKMRKADEKWMEKEEREQKTINIVEEQISAGGEEEEDEEMEDGWMNEIEEMVWKEMVNEVTKECKKEGKEAGAEEEIRKALESEVARVQKEKKEKRKRSVNDISEKEESATEKKVGRVRIIKNTKKAITKAVVTGLLASKHACITPVGQGKGKGKEKLRMKSPEIGESSVKRKAVRPVLLTAQEISEKL